jgi:hypothetical protein
VKNERHLSLFDRGGLDFDEGDKVVAVKFLEISSAPQGKSFPPCSFRLRRWISLSSVVEERP